MRKVIKFFIFFIILIGVFLFFRDDLLDLYVELSLRLPQIEKQFTDFLTKETEKQVSIPPPLRAEKEVSESFLTKTGVVQWTNIQRKKYGLEPLVENAQLNASAELKAKDMLENQYFAHYSPLGIGMEDLAESVGYEYVAVGENLALGNFQDDEILVQGWMDSLGHRENILSSHYQEIGVAVLKGTFEGRSTWFAVQHFGLPLSACPQPDEILKTKIETNQSQIERLWQDLRDLRIKIRAMRPKRGLEYNQMVEQYNSLISQYNTLVSETESLIYEYNGQVQLFNECVAEVK